MSTAQNEDEAEISTNPFSDSTFPLKILNKIWSYLIDETPLQDALVLTCKSFRDLTYNHPSHATRFHFRLEPQFKLNSAATNTNYFQIGASVTPATRRAIIVKSVEDAITNNENKTFPFHSLKVFNVAESSTSKDVIPFFTEFRKSIKFMSWNNCKFLNEDPNKNNSNNKGIHFHSLLYTHILAHFPYIQMKTTRRRN